MRIERRHNAEERRAKPVALLLFYKLKKGNYSITIITPYNDKN